MIVWPLWLWIVRVAMATLDRYGQPCTRRLALHSKHTIHHPRHIIKQNEGKAHSTHKASEEMLNNYNSLFKKTNQLHREFKAAQLFSTLLIINVSWAANQHIRMIYKGSCDIEDWSNGCLKFSIYLHHRIKLYFIILLFLLHFCKEMQPRWM